MRVFVVGTGRCGTCTFFQACKHISNFTTDHEGKSGQRDIGEWEYPDNHIEVAAHLAIAMGHLRLKYPEARWVHLIRNEENCVRSLVTNSQAPLDYFALHWLQAFQFNPVRCARVFYHLVNDNIRAMLPRGNYSMTIQLENIQNAWPEFWSWIEASGTYSSSLDTWTRKYNSTYQRGRDEWIPQGFQL